MAVLPNSIDEDEADIISRANELRDAFLEREVAAELARQYAQTLDPDDFNGYNLNIRIERLCFRIIRGAENIPLEVFINDDQEEEPEIPLVFPQKRELPEFFIIEE